MESYNFGVGRTLRIAFEFVALAILLLVGSSGAVTPTITTHQPASPLDIIVGNTQDFTVTVGNQNVILNWFLNDNTLLTNQTVNSSQVVTYSYKPAIIGIYKITANMIFLQITNVLDFRTLSSKTKPSPNSIIQNEM